MAGSTAGPDEIKNVLVPLIQETIDEVRNMYMRLRPSVLDDLGLLAALAWLSRDFENAYPAMDFRTQIEVTDSDVQGRLKVVIYRVVQEALKNAGRHSRANQVRVTLVKANDVVEPTIRDDGSGFRLEEALFVDDSLRGMGLSSMRERFHLAGGRLRIDSDKGKGTQIYASWPIRPDSA